MKRYSTYLTCLWLTTVALLLSACSHDQWEPEVVAGEAATPPQDSCYINLSIVNGSQMTTRATADGTAQENAVYDGILCIFEGDDAATATLRSAVAIDQIISNPYEPQTVAGGSATSINVTQRLRNTHTYDTHVYAAVLLNTTRSGYRVVDGNKLYFGDTNLTGNTNTFDTVFGQDIDDVGCTDRHVGLFMKSDALVEATALYDTEAEARTHSDDRNTIAVTRIAAKIIVSSDLTSGDDITNITLNGTSTKAKFHAMRWMLNPINAKDFTDFHQHALKSGDAIYVKPTTSSASIVVELQVKEGSFLIDEGYIFHAYNNTYTTGIHELYTSAKQYVKFLKEGLDDYQKGLYGLSVRSADEVFRQPTIYINDDGSITLTLTNYSFNASEQEGLQSLATNLALWNTGYRDGKMYYTYNIGPLARNNVYTLTFGDSSISYIGRPTP